MQKDYKMFPPSVDWDNINWSTRRAQMDFPVQVISKCDLFFLYYLNASFVEYYVFIFYFFIFVMREALL